MLLPRSSAPVTRWFRTIAVSALVLALVLLAAGFIYENIAEARDRRFNAMPGMLVEVAGRKMHLNCTGEGSPKVILESGLGDTYISWRKVQPEIAKMTRVCSYDRAGLGYSDSSSAPRTSKVIAEELHRLLVTAKVAPPYVLVGHSMGGYDVRVYTSLYPNEVVGMVLVDASHPDQENRFPAELKNLEAGWHREAEFLEFTMPFGTPRLFGLCEEDPVQRAADCNFHSARESREESNASLASAAQTAASGSLGDMPLAVLSHDPNKPSSELPPNVAKETNQAWEKMQEELAHLSTHGTQTVVRNSGHYIQIDRPDVVIDAVHRIVDEARTAPSPPNQPNH
jgi:pimeloyl-ACP methyl ester carboxylesterase